MWGFRNSTPLLQPTYSGLRPCLFHHITQQTGLFTSAEVLFQNHGMRPSNRCLVKCYSLELPRIRSGTLEMLAWTLPLLRVPVAQSLHLALPVLGVLKDQTSRPGVPTTHTTW